MLNEDVLWEDEVFEEEEEDFDEGDDEGGGRADRALVQSYGTDSFDDPDAFDSPLGSSSSSVRNGGSGGAASSAAAASDSTSSAALSRVYGSFDAASADAYVVVEESAAAEQLLAAAADVREVLDVSTQYEALMLLRAFNWNQEHLVESYLDNPRATRRRAALPPVGAKAAAIDPAAEVTCRVCFEDVSGADTYAMPCGHRFCRSCWKPYVERMLNNAPSGLRATCMEKGCEMALREEDVAQILGDDGVALFRKVLQRVLVAENPRIKFCPAPDCKYCVRSESAQLQQPVTCKCGSVWCYSCCDINVGDHTPASCAQVEMWREKARTESDNVSWLIENTKKCPQCKMPIEKNGGCMHMTCRGCKHEFCWMCRGAWKTHGSNTGGYYECNMFSRTNNNTGYSGALNPATGHASELECYIFYFHRYESHRNAHRAMEETQRSDARLQTLSTQYNLRLTELDFYREALRQLLVNLRILQWSYVFGYFLQLQPDRTAEQQLFSFLQSHVETMASLLSGLCENPPIRVINHANFSAWKNDVIGKTKLCHNYLEKFAKGVQSGLTSEKNF